MQCILCHAVYSMQCTVYYAMHYILLYATQCILCNALYSLHCNVYCQAQTQQASSSRAEISFIPNFSSHLPPPTPTEKVVKQLGTQQN